MEDYGRRALDGPYTYSSASAQVPSLSSGSGCVTDFDSRNINPNSSLQNDILNTSDKDWKSHQNDPLFKDNMMRNFESMKLGSSTKTSESQILPIRTSYYCEPLPTSNSSFASADDFEAMVSDLRRTFISWLKQTEAELKREKQELSQSRSDFEEEKRKFWTVLQEERHKEQEKIREERKRLQADAGAQLKQIQIERQDARQKLQLEREKFDADKDQILRKLGLERERFRLEYEAFQSEKQMVHDVSLSAETLVDINIGGVVFESGRATLTQQSGSLIEALVSGRHCVSRDKQGRIFIDRDPELFRMILNYLRNPTSPPLPRDINESDALAQEAAYYGIHLFPSRSIFVIGGHDGCEHLNSVEVLSNIEDFFTESRSKTTNANWRKCAGMSTDRSYFGCSNSANRIYVYGGQNLDYKALCDTEYYDVLRDIWTPASGMNIPRRNVSGLYAGGRHFAIGGFDGSTIMSSVEALDPRTRSWNILPSMKTPRSSGMCAVQGDRLLVLGGTRGERLRTVEAFDLKMEKWESLTCDMIEVRSAGCAVSHANHVYAIGGTDNSHRVHRSIEVLSPHTNKWAYISNMDTPRMDLAATAIDKSIVVTGGQDGDVYSKVSLLKLDTNEWIPIPDMMVSRYGHAAVACSI